jgi:mannan endo-1,4-beta-mannosidase
MYNLGGETNGWGNAWITNHAAACVAAGKPCVLEEYGTTSDHVSVESPWQATSLSSKGMAGDMFWQWGDTISSGQTANDGNTIYYGTSEWTSLVVDHVAAINGGTTPPPPTTTASATTTTKATSTSAAGGGGTTTTASSGGTSPHWGQCAGIGYTSPTVCASP